MDGEAVPSAQRTLASNELRKDTTSVGAPSGSHRTTRKEVTDESTNAAPRVVTRRPLLGQRKSRVVTPSRLGARAPLAPIPLERKASPVAKGDLPGASPWNTPPGSALEDPLADILQGPHKDAIVTRRSRSGMPVGRRRLAPVPAPKSRQPRRRNQAFSESKPKKGPTVLPRIGPDRQGFSARKKKLPTLQEHPAGDQRFFETRKQSVPLQSLANPHEAKWEVEEL